MRNTFQSEQDIRQEWCKTSVMDYARLHGIKSQYKIVKLNFSLSTAALKWLLHPPNQEYTFLD